MTDQPTIQDVIEIIEQLNQSMQAMGSRLTRQMGEMETRLNAKIDSLDAKIDRVKNELSSEIAGADGLHDDRIERLEAAVGE